VPVSADDGVIVHFDAKAQRDLNDSLWISMSAQASIARQNDATGHSQAIQPALPAVHVRFAPKADLRLGDDKQKARVEAAAEFCI
jgi:hypothetical protein